MKKHAQRRSEPPAVPPAPEPIEEPHVHFASQTTSDKPRKQAIADVLEIDRLSALPQPRTAVDMKPALLLARLAETGTGAAKLKAAHEWLMAHQSSNTDDFLAAMLQEGIFAEGTINKALALRAHERSNHGEAT